MGLFSNFPIAVPFIAYLCAVIAKAAFLMIRKEYSLSKALGSGGMPSAHSALVANIATLIGIKHGIGSDMFAITATFASIVLYDSMNVRFQSGLHARAINLIDPVHKFNESLGHRPVEVIWGGVLGAFVAFILI